eukprot:30914-Pelagococcus_subviridis.AAC.4
MRVRCLKIAAKPPNDSGDCIPLASPICITRSKSVRNGESRYVGNVPKRTLPVIVQHRRNARPLLVRVHVREHVRRTVRRARGRRKRFPKVLPAVILLDVRARVNQVRAVVVLEPLRAGPDDDAHAVRLHIPADLSHDRRPEPHAVDDQARSNRRAVDVQSRGVVENFHAAESRVLEDHAAGVLEPLAAPRDEPLGRYPRVQNVPRHEVLRPAVMEPAPDRVKLDHHARVHVFPRQRARVHQRRRLRPRDVPLLRATSQRPTFDDRDLDAAALQRGCDENAERAAAHDDVERVGVVGGGGVVESGRRLAGVHADVRRRRPRRELPGARPRPRGVQAFQRRERRAAARAERGRGRRR